ncbi:Lrp/AsnC family transcriptional regulator [Gluconobacter cerevisiae]|uniref:Lrp/AsnC family transcriptional regulator n=1 Tax=Gluconobacter cerevisiae TaxID=1379734 RepID=A0ABR9YDC5_9PROT|nr:Lrp/AsnC family transcriptional regulator [Gluconobacter cerevisiae]MBF0876651.1 Lrp/AsnC family transcriptional regulator [Gluconobacter cerevisiae]
MIKLDQIDRMILRVLQADGRLSNSDLAQRIGISAPACWKRLKRLEADCIVRYHAELDSKALGLNLFAFLSIMLDDHSEETMTGFEKAVSEMPGVIACHNVSGKYDYLLQIIVRDMEDFHALSMRQIRMLGCIKEMHTHFSIREIKRSGRLPV